MESTSAQPIAGTSHRAMCVLAMAVALLGPAVAYAGGRPPLTSDVQFRPGDRHSIYVATTFGLLISHDDGCSFRWICEQKIGYAGSFDPKYRIAADGTIFATTFTGLRVSRDGGCTFTTATADRPVGRPDRLAEAWIEAIDIGPTGELWIATADSGKPNNLYRSTDNGLSFEPRGMLSQAIWWKSIAVAPTRAQRIYATGYQVAGARPDGGQVPPTTHFVISDDGGARWTRSPLAGVQYGPTPLVLVAGVDRSHPDRVLMTSRGANPPSGDRLYRSLDGGVTWRDVLATAAPILDVAMGPDGQVVVATHGGGTFRSMDRGRAFARISGAPELACAGHGSDGTLYGCAADREPDFQALTRSARGTSWDKVLRFAELAGPVECPAGSPEHDVCGAEWPALRDQLGATGPAAACKPPAASIAPPPNPAASARRTGGCCDAGAPSAGTLTLGAAMCALVTRRRRRRRARPGSAGSGSRA